MDLGRLQNIDTEKSILATLIQKPQFMAESVLDTKDFYKVEHQDLFKTLKEMFAENIPIDIITASDEFQKRGYDKIHGAVTIHLMDFCDTKSLEIFKKREADVLELSKRRQTIRLCHEICTMAADQQTNITDTQSYLYDNFAKVMADGQDNEKILDLKDSISGVIEAMLQPKDNSKVYKTGYVDLDMPLGGGFGPGQLIVLAARPGMGKSALALNIATEGCRRYGASVCFVSLEMSKEELISRIIYSYTGYGSYDVANANAGRPPDGFDYQRLINVTEQVSKFNLGIEESSGIDVSALKVKLKQWRAKHEDKLDLVVIDYLQLMSAKGFKAGDRVNEVSEITRKLKLMAKELGCPVLVLSQLNRGVESRNDKRPLLSDLRDSGSIEQDADVVLMLYRGDYYTHESTNGYDVGELGIQKNRHGATGIIKLLYRQKCFRFDSYAENNPYEE